MRKQQLAAKVNNLTSLETKIFNAVPKAERWPRKLVHAELFRAGSQLSVNQVERVLMNLVNAGLVTMKDGKFQQTATRPKLASVPAPAGDESGPIPQTASEILRAVSERLADIAVDVASVADQIEAEGAAKDEDGEKMRALKKLLSEL